MKKVSTQDLAQRVALELNAPEEQARAVLDRTIDVIRKELQRGNAVDLPQLLCVQVKQGEPTVTTTQSGGTLGLPGSRCVLMELDEELRQAIEGAGLFKMCLVVPRKNFFTGVMASRLASARSEVTVIEGEAAAIEYIAQTKPDLVVLDVGLADAPSVCCAIKKNRQTSLTAIVQIYAEGVDPAMVEGLTVVPDEQINEPFELNSLVKLAESELARFAEERNFFEHEMHFRYATRDELLEAANDLLGEVLSASGLENEAAQALSVAAREAMDNAARHGNKSQENKYLDVQYLVDREKVTISISDEGEGFDTEMYLTRGVSGNAVEAARARSGSGGHGGLGIMLMLKCVDRLEYNYAGNKISLTRHIRKA